MNTVKLYDRDAYATEFDACVLSADRVGDAEKYMILLDETLFFPEEGGQSPDKGFLATADGKKIDVTDVQIRNGLIFHYTEHPLNAGEKIHGKIDFDHRFSNMQQHSGEHIFSGTVKRLFGFDNVGFHLSDNSVTMDFNGIPAPEDLKKVEDIVNRAIYENLEIKAYYPDPAELASLSYRSKKELTGSVRIVTIPGYDICACCAPHVKRTGEIGILKIISVKNYKGGVRINILCGRRALKMFRENIALIDSLTNIMTTGSENLIANVKALKNEKASLSSKLAFAKQELLLSELSNVPTGEKNVYVFRSDTDAFIMKNVLNRLLEKHDGVCALFSGNSTDGWTYMIGSRTGDTRTIAKKLSASFGAKGGGKPEMICGSMPGVPEEEIRKILNEK